MTDQEMSHVPFVNGVIAGAFWRAAHYWIGIWTGAGFPPKVDGDRIVMTKEWRDKFPDGPHLVNALRGEITGLLTKGGAAFTEDDRLKIPTLQPMYLEYLNERLDSAERQSNQIKRYGKFWANGNKNNPAEPETANHARKCAEEKDKLIVTLRNEIADLKKKLAEKRS